MDDRAQDVMNKQAPVIEPGYTFGTVTDKISSIVLTRPTSNGWFVGFGIAFLVTMGLLYAVGYLFVRGVGIWGVNIPVGWGFAIVNFVWWIGIGHAGTLISAILLLLRQSWRNSINRFAEAMTLFAVACAGMFPVLHLGRPWLAYWLFPYPNTMKVWPQFRSPLVWDVSAVSTYATISLLFWFIGLIPDLATLRDRSENRAAQIVYGMLARGWRGSARHWARYDMAFLLWNRLHGPYAFFYYLLLLCNIGIPQVLWIKKLRTSPGWLFLISGIILMGMWLERFIIVVVSLHRDFLTSSWGMYYPTRWDWMTYIGTIGFFLACMFLFLRVLPMISIVEMRTLLPEAEVKAE